MSKYLEDEQIARGRNKILRARFEPNPTQEAVMKRFVNRPEEKVVIRFPMRRHNNLALFMLSKALKDNA